MNKSLTLIFLVFLCTNSWSQDWFNPVGMTRIEVGYPHRDSFEKKQPTFTLEQSFLSLLNRKLCAGLGTGITVHPEAYTIPVFLQAGYRFRLKQMPLLWEHRIGMNLPASQNSIFSYRYNTTLSYTIRLTRRITGYAGLGTNFIWDHWGEKSLNGVASVSILYIFSKPRKKTEPLPRQNKDNPPW